MAIKRTDLLTTRAKLVLCSTAVEVDDWSTRYIAQHSTTWEDLSSEDYAFLANHIHKLPRKNDEQWVLVTEGSIPNAMVCLRQLVIEEQARLAKAKAEMEAAKKRREMAKRAKDQDKKRRTEEDRRRLFEQLRQEFDPGDSQ